MRNIVGVDAGKKLGIFQISPEVLIEILSCGSHVIGKGIPKNSKIISSRFDSQKGVFHVLLESDEFESVPRNEPIPVINVCITVFSLGFTHSNFNSFTYKLQEK